MTKPFICGILFLLGLLPVFPQSSDLLRIEYTGLPRNESEISVGRYRALFNYPIKVGNEQYLVAGAEYNKFDFDSGKPLPFDDDDLKKMQIIDLNLGYIFRWNENWRFVGIATPRLASNFVHGVQGRDFKMNFTATFWKERPDAEKPYRLVLGLTYNSTTGLPVPLPLINYYKRFHPNWSYALGIPRTSLRYHIGEKNMIQTALFLDGYFVNIQDDIVLEDGSLGSAISLSALIGALGYQHNFTKSMSVYGMIGFALTQDGVLRDNKRNSVYILNNQGNIYFRTGFKISIFNN